MSEAESILVVDDSPDTREVLRRNLTSKGHTVITSSGVTEAIAVLAANCIDLVITDIRMPGIDGFDLLRHVHENYKESEMLVITGFPSVEGAVRAMKAGADEYLAKPFTVEELFLAVDKALEKRRLKRKAIGPSILPARYGLIGESKAMAEVYRAIAKASASSATVLVQGESGTGKELIARAIHYGSRRASFPFVPVNCGSIPEQLLESELFGHIKGAFTGASTARAGFFQTADRGTILLDEISEASLSMQVKLLRVLQEKEICMLGSSTPRKVDVRICAATNKDLSALIKKGLFREDLFYRLNVFTIVIPPLRERGDDIIPLIQHFIARKSEEFGRKPPLLSEEALAILRGYHWPGNVRELENVVQRLVAMADGDLIEVPDLPSLMRFSALRTGDLTRTLAEVEAEYIQSVLDSVNGNKSLAARILDVDRKTLREKLRKTDA
ncbi:MAG: sigma-54 dependent transcriptional regulator [Syntrophobacteraceae bacterium]|nr:sigma-54 dependent transcriptional regulator [Desulfobacteraceae bacterium]